MRKGGGALFVNLLIHHFSVPFLMEIKSNIYLKLIIFVIFAFQRGARAPCLPLDTYVIDYLNDTRDVSLVLSGFKVKVLAFRFE